MASLVLAWMTLAMTAAFVQAQPCRLVQGRFGFSCYELLTGKMKWDEGNLTCSDRGGSLAVPDSPEEHQFLWNMLTQAAISNESLWTGCQVYLKDLKSCS